MTPEDTAMIRVFTHLTDTSRLLLFFIPNLMYLASRPRAAFHVKMMMVIITCITMYMSTHAAIILQTTYDNTPEERMTKTLAYARLYGLVTTQFLFVANLFGEVALPMDRILLFIMYSFTGVAFQ